MSNNLKKGAILSLSLLLTTTFSISTTIPAMTRFYAGYSMNQVEQLVSLPSLAVMLIIMLHPLLSEVISKNVSIITGLILLFLTGIMPLFSQDYTYVFVSRMIHGVGVGLINVYAVTIINESFSGQERAAMLGYRGAAEILGNIICTFIAGQILSLGVNWQYSFLIYAASAPILLLYLWFLKSSKDPGPESGSVPDNSGNDRSSVSPAASGAVSEAATSWKNYIMAFIFYGLCGMVIVGINCCNTIRIPSLVIEKGLGAEAEASILSSLRMGAGFLAGISFWRFEQRLGKQLQPVFFIALGIGELAIAFSSDIFMLFIGSLIVGAALSILTTSIFQNAAEYFPLSLSDKATTSTLVGCNLGSGLASYVLYLIDCLNDKMYTSFLVFGIIFLPVGVILMIKKKRRS